MKHGYRYFFRGLNVGDEDAMGGSGHPVDVGVTLVRFTTSNGPFRR